MLMTDGWRERLLAAIEADGRPHRTISLAAKLGPNFVSELHHTVKDPRIQNVLKLAAELNMSLSYLFLGTDATPEDEELLKILHGNPDLRRHLVSLLQAMPQTKDQ